MKNVMTLDPILSLGSEAQINISNLSEMMLDTIRNEKMEEVLDLMNQTILYMQEFDQQDKNTLRTFLTAKKHEVKIEDHYRIMEKKVDQIMDKLKEHEIVLLKNETMYEQYDRMNKTYRKQLDACIDAGREELKKMAAGELITRRFQPKDDFITMDDATYERRLQKRINDLLLSTQISDQMTMQIALMIRSNQKFYARIQDMLLNTVVLWKNQVIVLLQKKSTRISERGNMEKQNAILLDRFHEMIDLAKEQQEIGREPEQKDGLAIL